MGIMQAIVTPMIGRLSIVTSAAWYFFVSAGLENPVCHQRLPALTGQRFSK